MTKKKNNKQRLEDSLSEAINPRPKVDRLNNVHSLLDSYRPEQKNLPENSLDAQTNIIGRPEPKDLGAKTPKLLSEVKPLDAKTSKNKKLGAQNSKNWVKYESNRSTDRLALRPSVEILLKARVYAAENNLNLTELFELSVMNLIELDAQNSKKLGVLTPLDDRRRDYLYKTNPSIVNLFREYNKIFNPKTDWKPKDDAVGVKYNDIDLRVIEIGIIQTQSNILEGESDTKPERFKYYTREIDKFNSLGYSDQLLDAILTTNRKRWREITGREVDLRFLNKE
jgi:hypothetical protein